jgi:hypothetical protein
MGTVLTDSYRIHQHHSSRSSRDLEHVVKRQVRKSSTIVTRDIYSANINGVINGSYSCIKITPQLHDHCDLYLKNMRSTLEMRSTKECENRFRNRDGPFLAIFENCTKNGKYWDFDAYVPNNRKPAVAESIGDVTSDLRRHLVVKFAVSSSKYSRKFNVFDE